MKNLTVGRILWDYVISDPAKLLSSYVGLYLQGPYGNRILIHNLDISYHDFNIKRKYKVAIRAGFRLDIIAYDTVLNPDIKKLIGLQHLENLIRIGEIEWYYHGLGRLNLYHWCNPWLESYGNIDKLVLNQQHEWARPVKGPEAILIEQQIPHPDSFFDQGEIEDK